MLLREEEKNIVTGMLGAIAIHLLILVIVLFAHVNKVKHQDKKPIEIQIDDADFKTRDQVLQENLYIPQSVVQNLTPKDIANAVSSAESQMTDARDIEKEIMQEEGIEDLHPENTPDESQVAVINKEQLDQKNSDEKDDGPVKRKGDVTLEYKLGKRIMLKPYKIPSYTCFIGGVITIGITVDKNGMVTNAELLQAIPEDDCLVRHSLIAAKASRFNIDENASDKEKGTITFKFTPQSQ